MVMTPQQGASTLRTRQEIEAPRLLKSRQEIPLVRMAATFSTILTARADAYFEIEGLWVANVTNAAHSYSICLVPSGGTATIANALAWEIALPANTVDYAVGAAGMLVPPGYTVQVDADAADVINVYGWGWNVVGDSQ